MSQIVVDFVRIVEGILQSLIVYLTVQLLTLDHVLVVLAVAFLNEDFGAKLFQKFVCLSQ